MDTMVVLYVILQRIKGGYMLRYIFTATLLVSLLFFSPKVMAGGYLLSAHGSNIYGVDRTATATLGYAQGNCAHCHEMHASIGGVEPVPATGAPSVFALFANNFNTLQTLHPYTQSDDFCFYCHTSVDSLQNGGITNKDYSATFAGAPETVTSIFDQFNELSYHNLYDIYHFAQNTFPSFFTSYSNPCIACHNPHLARRDKANVTNPAYSAVSLPTDHNKLWTTNLKTYTAYYQAPYYYHSTSSYEPGASLVTDGSNVVDWNTFCTRCHNKTNVIYSTTLGRNLRNIDWIDPISVSTTGAETGGDKHGQGNATGNITMTLLPPYSTYLISHGYTSGITLSCLDCHEPHGAPNIMLLRRVINGNDTWDDTYTGTIINVTTYDSTQWVAICDRCHISDEYSIHHGGTLTNYDYPYVAKGCVWCHGSPWNYINCTHCHFHGGDDSWLLTLGVTPTYRRCF